MRPAIPIQATTHSRLLSPQIDEVSSALLLEQAAIADLNLPKTSRRKYAFHMAMAAARYEKSGLVRAHLIVKLALALTTFGPLSLRNRSLAGASLKRPPSIARPPQSLSPPSRILVSLPLASRRGRPSALTSITVSDDKRTTLARRTTLLSTSLSC